MVTVMPCALAMVSLSPPRSVTRAPKDAIRRPSHAVAATGGAGVIVLVGTAWSWGRGKATGLPPASPDRAPVIEEAAVRDDRAMPFHTSVRAGQDLTGTSAHALAGGRAEAVPRTRQSRSDRSRPGCDGPIRPLSPARPPHPRQGTSPRRSRAALTLRGRRLRAARPSPGRCRRRYAPGSRPRPRSGPRRTTPHRGCRPRRSRP